MRIISEQSVNTRLRIAPKDWADMPEEEQLAFIESLRGDRGKAPVRKAKAAGTAKSPAIKANQPASVEDFGDDI